MRKKLAIICLALAIIFGIDNKNTTEAHVAVGFNLFFDALSPHGNWVSVPTYGYVWYPTLVRLHWRPYTDGRWVWSDYGWTWVSYEPWGWAPYHYGRWAFLDYYGWVWIPGTIWAPAWVTWYTSPEYIGWAPLAPDYNFFLEIGIGFNSYNYYAPQNHCVFVPSHEFLYHNVYSVVVPQSHNVKIFKEAKHINNVKIVNNNVINRGPDVGFVERVARTKVNKVNLVEKDIDINRVIKTSANVNKLDGKNYYVFRPDVVRKDKGIAPPNGGPPRKTLQIENTNDRLSSENNLQKLHDRKYPKIKKDYLKNTARNRNKNELSYSNNNVMDKDGAFQNQDTIGSSSNIDRHVNLDNQKRNSFVLENTNKLLYQDIQREKHNELRKKTASQALTDLKSRGDNLNKILDSNNSHKMIQRYYESKTSTKEEKINMTGLKNGSRSKEKDLDSYSNQNGKEDLTYTKFK